ncbi:MAG: hypothetical protein ACFFDT_38845 [Candidatus Hodarchaeota archaeon]
MDGLVFIILAVALLFPLAFVAYINVGGLYRAMKSLLGAKESVEHKKTLTELAMIDA